MLIVSIVCARRCMCKCLHVRLCVSIWMFTCLSVCFCMQLMFATCLYVCVSVCLCVTYFVHPTGKEGDKVQVRSFHSRGSSTPHTGKPILTFFINCTQLHCGQEVASHNKDCGECRHTESCFPQKDFNGGIYFIFTHCWWTHQLCYSPCSLIISVLMMRKRRRKYAASALCSVFPNFLKNVSPPIDVSSVFPTALTSRHLYSNT